MLHSESPARSDHGTLIGSSHGSVPQIALACLLLFAGALLIRWIGLYEAPIFDEMYTVLAAKGWLLAGEPRIGEGIYDRAELYTIIVAWFFDAFGDGVVAARVPSLIAGSLLVVAVFLWTRSVAGSLAAWIAALFVALSPINIQVSQFARFYALQGLLFWLASVGVYMLCSRPFDYRGSIPIGVACAIAFLFAYHLQLLTLVGAVGVALWVGCALFIPWLWSLRARPQLFWGIIGLLAVFALAALTAATLSGVVEAIIERYRWAPLHNAASRNEIWYYHLHFIERYPSLWPLFPLAALLAIAARPRPAWFCLSVFIPGFILISFAGMKHFKYLTFITPFLFVIWAIALAEAFSYLRAAFVTITDRALERSLPNLPRRPARWALIAICLLFLAVANGAPARTLLLPFGIQLTPEGAPVDWAAARETLQSRVDDASIVLTNEEMAIYYFYGRHDFTLSASRRSELDDPVEFGLDTRTGRPVISTVESVERIMNCFPDGLLLTNTKKWRDPSQIGNQVADLIEERGEWIEVPKGSRIVAIRWERPESVAPGADCTSLPAPANRASTNSSASR
jgi:4-amino-4-deoxy-L-arabinose transferase-like glycosyltransferase